MNKVNVSILPNYFLKEDGTFDKDEALKLSGKIAGICYDKEGFSHLENEPYEKTLKRINMTLDNGHHSVYDHIYINFDMKNIPKVLAMVLNNEHQYTTSEKSARYTPIKPENNSVITKKEEDLYNKWVDIYKVKIKKEYGNIFSDFKINKLAGENARYLVTVFMPTEMIYTTSLRQINYLASWMLEYIKNIDSTNEFEVKLAEYMKHFIGELDRLNVLDARLMTNDKKRNVSLFGSDLASKKENFDDIYSTNYKATFAQVAQAQRHRTLDYKIEMMNQKEYYVPPILMDDDMLVNEWLNDMNSVRDVTPQGEIVLVNEIGKYEDFILKCKERLCTAAQLEIMRQTLEILKKYQSSLEASNSPLKEDIKKYNKGARCTFSDYTCTSDCKFNEGKVLTRRI